MEREVFNELRSAGRYDLPAHTTLKRRGGCSTRYSPDVRVERETPP